IRLSSLRAISHYRRSLVFSFFFTAPPPPDTSPLSLHDALPILPDLADDRVRLPLEAVRPERPAVLDHDPVPAGPRAGHRRRVPRSEEHTSELQSQSNLVCRLLLEKKKKKKTKKKIHTAIATYQS